MGDDQCLKEGDSWNYMINSIDDFSQSNMAIYDYWLITDYMATIISYSVYNDIYYDYLFIMSQAAIGN